MNMITAVLKKKKLKTNWGFNFNTEIQEYVESGMHKMHVSSSDYWLCFTKDAPEGVYTKIEVKELKDKKSNVIGLKFFIK